MFVRVKFTKSTFHQADANTRVPFAEGAFHFVEASLAERFIGDGAALFDSVPEQPGDVEALAERFANAPRVEQE